MSSEHDRGGDEQPPTPTEPSRRGWQPEEPAVQPLPPPRPDEPAEPPATPPASPSARPSYPSRAPDP